MRNYRLQRRGEWSCSLPAGHRVPRCCRCRWRQNRLTRSADGWGLLDWSDLSCNLQDQSEKLTLRLCWQLCGWCRGTVMLFLFVGSKYASLCLVPEIFDCWLAWLGVLEWPYATSSSGTDTDFPGVSVEVEAKFLVRNMHVQLKILFRGSAVVWGKIYSRIIVSQEGWFLSKLKLMPTTKSLPEKKKKVRILLS